MLLGGAAVMGSAGATLIGPTAARLPYHNPADPAIPEKSPKLLRQTELGGLSDVDLIPQKGVKQDPKTGQNLGGARSWPSFGQWRSDDRGATRVRGLARRRRGTSRPAASRCPARSRPGRCLGHH